jgi:hypothetical protein
MNMFNTDQRRTVVIAILAVSVGFLMSLLSGCDGSGEATNDSGVPLSVLLPDGGINTKLNPCGTAPGCTLQTCGWDVTTNKCYSTPWCGPSTPSTNPNAYGSPDPTYGTSTRVRPTSAVCDGGVSGYTYPVGTVMVWGANVQGSNSDDAYTIAHHGYESGFICVPNQVATYFSC